MGDSSTLVRPAGLDDAQVITTLMGQLGYPLTIHTVRQRLLDSLPGPDSAVAVAVRDGIVVGWIEVRLVAALETGALAEIVGLVVADTARGHGVGTTLTDWAKSWAKSRGQTRLRVRTNVIREGAAAFYRKQGFGQVKQQRVFEAALQ